MESALFFQSLKKSLADSNNIIYYYHHWGFAHLPMLQNFPAPQEILW